MGEFSITIYISILNIHMSTGAMRISIWDIVISMIANAWYPIHYFKLSFGKNDSMYMAIKAIRELTDLPYDASKKLIEETLRDQLDKKEIKAALRVFTLNVPFRFLSPWINTSENKDVVRRSHSFENGALYALHKDDIEDWIIEKLQNIGCDTAKSVLALSPEDIAKRADLEDETVEEVLDILRAEFEDEE